MSSSQKEQERILSIDAEVKATLRRCFSESERARISRVYLHRVLFARLKVTLNLMAVEGMSAFPNVSGLSLVDKKDLELAVEFEKVKRNITYDLSVANVIPFQHTALRFQ